MSLDHPELWRAPMPDDKEEPPAEYVTCPLCGFEYDRTQGACPDCDQNPYLCHHCQERPHNRTTGPDHPMYESTWYWCAECSADAAERQAVRDLRDYYTA